MESSNCRYSVGKLPETATVENQVASPSSQVTALTVLLIHYGKSSVRAWLAGSESSQLLWSMKNKSLIASYKGCSFRVGELPDARPQSSNHILLAPVFEMAQIRRIGIETNYHWKYVVIYPGLVPGSENVRNLLDAVNDKGRPIIGPWLQSQRSPSWLTLQMGQQWKLKYPTLVPYWETQQVL